MADLGARFDEDVASESDTKDVDATMRRMTAEPWVWDLPAPHGG